VLAGAVVAAGCGGSAAPKGPAVQLPSYLAQYPIRQPVAVYFLQWEQRGKALDGTLSFVFPTRMDTPTRTQPLPLPCRLATRKTPLLRMHDSKLREDLR